MVVEAMLQSPDFLFHVEAGPDGRSTITISPAGCPICSGYDARPSLFGRRRQGRVAHRSRDVRTHARRLMDDPTSHQVARRFFDQWLRFDRVLNTSKEEKRFPDFSLEMAQNMVEETRRLLDHLVWDNQNFMELFTANYAYLSTDLASLYGLPAPTSSSIGQVPDRFPARGNLGRGVVPGCQRWIPLKRRRPRAASSSANNCCASKFRRRRRTLITNLPKLPRTSR